MNWRGIVALIALRVNLCLLLQHEQNVWNISISNFNLNVYRLIFKCKQKLHGLNFKTSRVEKP